MAEDIIFLEIELLYYYTRSSKHAIHGLMITLNLNYTCGITWERYNQQNFALNIIIRRQEWLFPMLHRFIWSDGASLIVTINCLVNYLKKCAEGKESIKPTIRCNRFESFMSCTCGIYVPDYELISQRFDEVLKEKFSKVLCSDRVKRL